MENPGWLGHPGRLSLGMTTMDHNVTGDQETGDETIATLRLRMSLSREDRLDILTLIAENYPDFLATYLTDRVRDDPERAERAASAVAGECWVSGRSDTALAIENAIERALDAAEAA